MPTRVLIFIVSYQAEAFLSSVLARIPAEFLQDPAYEVEILVIDDQSQDRTFEVGHEYARLHPNLKLQVLYNPVNQGYGGNQKIGYHYAIKHGFDVVVLLHGDGQYAPEFLPQMLAPFAQGADCVLGSRMVRRQDALKGGMPLYKWVGNQILTRLQNAILGCQLAEFHTGYRAYRTATLAKVPFQTNSNYFDFDTDILIQMLDTHSKIVEIAIPTFYGDEISRVNGMKYGGMILRTSLLSRIVRFGIFYDPRFDYLPQNSQYTLKLGYPSSHEFALQVVEKAQHVLDIASGPNILTETLQARGKLVTAVNNLPSPAQPTRDLAEIVQYTELPPVDTVLLLDSLEHSKQPEKLLQQLRARYGADQTALVLTTGNVGFFLVRLSHLFGMFNYSKKGILDMDHARLFTLSSLRRCVQNAGFTIQQVTAIPAPYPLAFGNTPFARLCSTVNGWLCALPFLRGLFAYQYGLTAHPTPTLEHLLASAENASRQRRAQGES
ncbi:MAG TPA: glycosyltransferase [Anaerolineales bacterium]|nr:glycosyltransferase [Anaerolineales bacterium]